MVTNVTNSLPGLMGEQHRLITAALGLHLLALCGAVSAETVRSATFACDSGPYAIVLPKHYPSLHVIGRHKTTDVDSRTVGSATITTRRIEYIGMTLEVLISSAAPDAYRITSLDLISLRWHIGPMSVNQNLWRTVKDPALDGVSQDGIHEIVGTRDRATVVVRGGRVQKVSYRCSDVGSK